MKWNTQKSTVRTTVTSFTISEAEVAKIIEDEVRAKMNYGDDWAVEVEASDRYYPVIVNCKKVERSEEVPTT